MKPQIHILDAAYLPFGHKALSHHSENKETPPTYFDWCRYEGGHTDLCFLTDTYISRSDECDATVKIAWPLEPHPYRQSNYDYLVENWHKFDYVLTYSMEYLKKIPNALFAPWGGCSVLPHNRGIRPKSKLCSMIVSEKQVTGGHKLRHEIAEKVKDIPGVDVMGSRYGDRVTKHQALADYAFTIIVEGENLNYFFDEEIIDAMMYGTIPLWIGMDRIKSFFDGAMLIRDCGVASGQPHFDYVMDNLSLPKYYGRFDDVLRNHQTAQQYASAEDWIWRNLPFIFEGIR